MKRILTAAVAVPILLFAVWSDSPYFFVGLTAVAIVIGVHEFYSLASRLGNNVVVVLGYPAALLLLVAFVKDRPAWALGTITALTLLSLAISITRSSRVSAATGSVAATVFGVVYAGLLPAYLAGVRMIPDTLLSPAIPRLAPKLLTTFFAMVMMTDTGAYYTGRTLGRHKLAPRVSPGKTIEGSIGGFVAAVTSGLICRAIFFPELRVSHALALGATMGIVSQIGDLAESLLKRSANVKDSGTIFPGHGGMLDRIDSLLFCAPVLYYYAILILE
jgi:phosphatidate cytidylyltransferase